MEGYYIIFERPHLQEFLDFLFENFNVSIWTAATKDYALFIIEKIILSKPNRKIDWIFFSYHCNVSKKIKKGTKDLSMLWDFYKIPGYNQNNTIILDDYDEVHSTQTDNCIIAKPFKFSSKNSEKDDFFIQLIPKLKKYILEKELLPKNKLNAIKNMQKVPQKDRAIQEKEGIDLEIEAIHPLTGQKVPVWVANFVLSSYGEGAVMAVPAHDQRDFEFAKKYDLPIKQVIEKEENFLKESDSIDYSNQQIQDLQTLIYNRSEVCA